MNSTKGENLSLIIQYRLSTGCFDDFCRSMFAPNSNTLLTIMFNAKLVILFFLREASLSIYIGMDYKRNLLFLLLHILKVKLAVTETVLKTIFFKTLWQKRKSQQA